MGDTSFARDLKISTNIAKWSSKIIVGVSSLCAFLD